MARSKDRQAGHYCISAAHSRASGAINPFGSPAQARHPACQDEEALTLIRDGS